MQITWPWPQHTKNKVYGSEASDGPELQLSQSRYYTIQDVKFRVMYADDAFLTGRRVYSIECADCNIVLHKRTTGLQPRIEQHLKDCHSMAVQEEVSHSQVEKPCTKDHRRCCACDTFNAME